MGRSYQGFRGMRTNIYTIGIAPSGSGKDHPLKIGKRFLKAADLAKHIQGQPSSGSSFPSMLKESGSKAIVYTDEIGRVLAMINSDKAANFERGIAKELMELYSSASDTYYGKAYANRKENEMIIVEEPCVCLYGTTVKENLIDALVGRDALDGFLARILLFESTEHVKLEKDVFALPTVNVPTGITSDLKRLSRRKNTADGEIPHQVGFTAEAKAAFLECWHRKDELCVDYPLCAPIYNRTTEHVAKLSMLAATDNLLQEQYIIEEKHMRWAISAVDYCIGLMVDTVNNEIADTPRLKLSNRIVKILKEHGSLKHRELMQRIRDVNTEDIKKALHDLGERGTIEVQLGPRGGKTYSLC